LLIGQFKCQLGVISNTHEPWLDVNTATMRKLKLIIM